MGLDWKINMNIVVLGGSGLIGSALVKELSELGHNVTSFDIVTGQDLRHLGETEIEAIYNSDFVFFMAFDVGGSKYLENYQHSFTFIDNNIKIMHSVFGALDKLGKPFIFASSQMSNMNHSPYGVLKRIGEFYSKSIGGTVVKFWNVYGYEDDTNKSHVITDFIRMAMNDGEIICRTSGLEERQFLYVDEAVFRLIEIMNGEGNDGTTFEVTSDEWVTIREVAAIISAEFGYCPVSFSGEWDTVQKTNKNQTEMLLNWKTRIPLKEGIRKVIAEVREKG